MNLWSCFLHPLTSHFLACTPGCASHDLPRHHDPGARTLTRLAKAPARGPIETMLQNCWKNAVDMLQQLQVFPVYHRRSRQTLASCNNWQAGMGRKRCFGQSAREPAGPGAAVYACRQELVKTTSRVHPWHSGDCMAGSCRTCTININSRWDRCHNTLAVLWLRLSFSRPSKLPLRCSQGFCCYRSTLRKIDWGLPKRALYPEQDILLDLGFSTAAAQRLVAKPPLASHQSSAASSATCSQGILHEPGQSMGIAWRLSQRATRLYTRSFDHGSHVVGSYMLCLRPL